MASSSIHLLGEPANNEMTSQSCRFKVLCSAIKTGNWVWFPAFITEEHFWRISCGPGVFGVPHQGEVTSLTFYLNYGGECKDVEVSFDLGLLKKDEQLSSVKWKTTVHTFPMHGNYFLLDNFVQGDELKKFLKDDYLVVLCNITILSAFLMGTVDSGVTILSSLTGLSQNHCVEAQSIENDGLVRHSLNNSVRSTKKEMDSGFFKFKVKCSHIISVENFHFPIFMVGEHCWQMGCYYDKVGCYLSLYFDVHSATKDLEVNLELGLLKKGEGPSLVKWETFTHTFEKCGESIYLPFSGGVQLQEYLQDDYLIVICNLTILSETIPFHHDVTILNNTRKPKAPSFDGPSPYLQDHLSKLLQNKERVDVTFEVNGEHFHAHKLILAARSPVFNAELFGPMSEDNVSNNIKVNEIEPIIFNAMLLFIYTDILPDFDDGSNNRNVERNQMNSIEMFQHLLVAADRYALERLKVMCEDKLARIITVDTVGTTLALAEQHNCLNLKARCIEFLSSPQNLVKVALTDGYRHLLLSCPTILEELRDAILMHA